MPRWKSPNYKKLQNTGETAEKNSWWIFWDEKMVTLSRILTGHWNTTKCYFLLNAKTCLENFETLPLHIIEISLMSKLSVSNWNFLKGNFLRSFKKRKLTIGLWIVRQQLQHVPALQINHWVLSHIPSQ